MAWTNQECNPPQVHRAEVVELVDTIASGAIGSNLIGVQISSSAPGYSVTVTFTIRVREILGSNPSAPTKLDIGSFRKKVRARFARALGGFYSGFPPQSAIRPTNPIRLFWQAGGGSELRSNSQMKFVSNFFLSAFGGIRSQFFNPALYGQRRLVI